MNASYTITSRDGLLIARDDETGDVVVRVPSDTTITARTDSHAVVAEFGSYLVGTVTSVTHDSDTIHVCVTIPAAIGLEA